MALFAPPRPNGITKEELTYIRGELRQAPFGSSFSKLTDAQVEEIMDDLNDAMDPDTPNDMKYGWAQVSPAEVADIEQDAAKSQHLKYSSAQLKHIHDVLGKYLSINKVKSAFSI